MKLSILTRPKKLVCAKCRKGEPSLWIGAASGMIYRCNKCSYVGPLFLEVDTKFDKAAERRGKRVVKK